MIFERRNTKDLLFAGYNPRKDLQPGDDEYEKIRKSIQEYGYVDPVIINRDNTIIGGHQRVKVIIDFWSTENRLSYTL